MGTPTEVTTTQDDQTIFVGGDDGAVPHTFDGRIDEIAVYPRALRPDEIAHIYSAGGVDKGGSGVQSIVIQGNLIGTDRTGTTALANGGDGIKDFDSFNDTIGGAAAGAANLISGNTGNGVHISGPYATAVAVQGNRIGTNLGGTAALANATGVLIDSGATGNTIGGLTATPGTAPGNLISGQTAGYGVELNGSGTGNVILGNRIGTDATGSAAIANIDGVLIQSPGNTVGGTAAGAANLISGNSDDGVRLIGAGVTGDVVTGNWIGTAATGELALPNAAGVEILSGAAADSIGGTAAGAGNVISGNSSFGVYLSTATATDNVVLGNRIGMDPSGAIAVPNNIGVYIVGPANTIGGTVAGAGNVISGNTSWGLAITGASASNNLVAGNLIGTDATGTTRPASNQRIGVYLLNGGTGNTIGGTTATARNVISGNTQNGILLGAGSGSTGNLIEGNYIGTNAAGTAAISDGGGVVIQTAGNTIGGTLAGAGNVISGNILGLTIEGSHTGTLVEGNLIGTNAAGTAAIPNSTAGVEINGDSGITIGGIAAAAGNLISGNTTGDGILISGATATGNLVIGNRIGTDTTGTAALANSYGVVVSNASANTIGGTIAAATNLISGNANSGVEITGTSTANLVEGNVIGLDDAETAALANAMGVLINAGATGNTIGGLAASPGTGPGNVISGNTTGDGVELDAAGSGNVILGNLIGTDATGKAAIPNSAGVYVLDSPGGTVGGTAAGAANLISGNAADGVVIAGTAGTGNVVEGDRIGTDITGSVALANVNGVLIATGAASNTVGGTAAGAGNIISGNTTGDGVELDAAGAGNAILGNRIGTDAAGAAAVPNAAGVYLDDSPGGTVGGTAAGARNIISGNTEGVVIAGVGSTSNVVEGNWIGTDLAGASALANGDDGVLIATGASGNTVGGTAAGTGNVVAGNNHAGNVGVRITGVGTSNNLVEGNTIGLSSAGAALGNYIGVEVDAGATTNTIGGLTATPGQNAGNVISANSDIGVAILASNSTANLVEGNLIGPDPAGTAVPGVQQDGIYLSGPGNTIGGTIAGARNIIAGNTINGIELPGNSDLIEGNFIGTDIAGAHPLGNFNDIAMTGSNDTIGGLAATAGTGPGNVISGSSKYSIFGLGADNLIEGNLIGTDATGVHAIANAVGMRMGGTGNTVGGTASGARNVISAAGLVAVQFDGAGVQGNVIQGNYIGTDITGTVAIPSRDGVAILNGATNNTVGGTAVGAGNVVSASTEYGVSIGSASNNVVIGNLIGTNAAGTAALANGWYGVEMDTGAAGNTVGGTAAGARNVISGNTLGGVYLTGAGVTGNTIEGNFIGTDKTGSAAVGNTGDGVEITGGSTANTIGGTAAGAGNIIAGNTGTGVAGIAITGSGANSNLVEGNRIGTDASGENPLPNTNGVVVNAGASGNTIGGVTAMAGTGAGNVISGNTSYGVQIGSSIFDAASLDNVVAGNLVGTDSTGEAAVPDGNAGLVSTAVGTTIGGTAVGAGNVISGNTNGNVLVLTDTHATDNLIAGNLIGLDRGGTTTIGDPGSELTIESPGNTIGGTTIAARNVISGFTALGINLDYASATGNLIEGNYIGTDAAGTTVLDNGGSGIWEQNGAAGNTIGGTVAGAGNLVDDRGAGTYAMLLTGDNFVAGDLIDANPSGTAALGQTYGGIAFGGSNNTVGGTVAAARNILPTDGIWLKGSAQHNLVEGNFTGLDITGTTKLSNNSGYRDRRFRQHDRRHRRRRGQHPRRPGLLGRERRTRAERPRGHRQPRRGQSDRHRRHGHKRDRHV